MARGKRTQPLRLPEEASVPDDGKGEIHRRLRRIVGQVEGLDRMLSDDRPCVDLLTQISAVREALRGTGRLVARCYLERCVALATKAGRQREVYDRLMETIFTSSR